MPQLLLLALVGAGAFAAGRLLAKAARKQSTASRQSDAGPASHAKDLGTLRRDPHTGEYRPG